MNNLNNVLVRVGCGPPAFRVLYGRLTPRTISQILLTTVEEKRFNLHDDSRRASNIRAQYCLRG